GSSICVQLERRLVAETQGGNQGRDLLPRIENDMRQLERNYQVAQQQLNRADCWDQFLFSRTLKRKPICIQLAGEVDASRQRLADLEAQRRQIMGTGNRSFQDDIIRELAGTRRALLPPKPRRGRRADGFSQQPAALYEPEIGVALPQGVRAGLLVQGGRIPAAGGRRQESRSTSGAGWAERDRATQHEVVA